LPFGRYWAAHNLFPRRSQFWTSFPAGGTEVRFQCDLSDDIAREVCFLGCYEPQETLLASAVIGPGMTVVDLGANWGYFALVCAHRVGASGRVLAVEPHPQLVSLLRENLGANGFDWATALALAVSNSDTEGVLIGYESLGFNSGVSRLSQDGEDRGHIVKVRTVDRLLSEQGIDDVDLLKMDLEGAEGLALEGMEQGLARHRYKRLLIECHPSELSLQGRTVEELIGRLLEMGYRGWRIDHGRSTFRRCAYGRRTRLGDLLIRLDGRSVEVDEWPHYYLIDSSLPALI